MRVLKFEQITDSRFDADPESKINRIAREILTNLNSLVGVSVEICTPILLNGWGDGSFQYRQTYFVKKMGRKITWNDIMDAINKVKAPRYQFC